MQIITAFIEGSAYDDVRRTLHELDLDVLATQPVEIATDEPTVETWRGSRRVTYRHGALRIEVPYDGDDAEGIAAAILAAGRVDGHSGHVAAWISDVRVAGGSTPHDISRLVHPAHH